MSYPPQAVSLIVVSAIFPLLALTTAFLRFKARMITHTPVNISDYFIIFTLVRALLRRIAALQLTQPVRSLRLLKA